ncbi:hypothetical protein VTI74DRAFT_4499 [Chaetomium olivicolor]
MPILTWPHKARRLGWELLPGSGFSKLSPCTLLLEVFISTLNKQERFCPKLVLTRACCRAPSTANLTLPTIAGGHAHRFQLCVDAGLAKSQSWRSCISSSHFHRAHVFPPANMSLIRDDTSCEDQLMPMAICRDGTEPCHREIEQTAALRAVTLPYANRLRRLAHSSKS